MAPARAGGWTGRGEGKEMEDHPVEPIKAKVEKLRAWHSYPVRYCYAFCRILFIIVGAAAGGGLASIAYCAATHTLPGQTAAESVVTVIGGVVGLATGWYLAVVVARIARALVLASNRPDAPSKPRTTTTDITGR